MTSHFGEQLDHYFMSQALLEAHKALEKNEVPIGAVVVDAQGHIVSRGYNAVEELHTQRAHAENTAIALAGEHMKNWRLDGFWLYVTLEPCLMCIGLMRLSRLAGVVFAAGSPVYGFRLDKDVSYQVYKDDTIKIIQGVCEQESVALLQQFFQKRRKERE